MKTLTLTKALFYCLTANKILISLFCSKLAVEPISQLMIASSLYIEHYQKFAAGMKQTRISRAKLNPLRIHCPDLP